MTGARRGQGALALLLGGGALLAGAAVFRPLDPPSTRAVLAAIGSGLLGFGALIAPVTIRQAARPAKDPSRATLTAAIMGPLVLAAALGLSWAALRAVLRVAPFSDLILPVFGFAVCALCSAAAAWMSYRQWRERALFGGVAVEPDEPRVRPGETVRLVIVSGKPCAGLRGELAFYDSESDDEKKAVRRVAAQVSGSVASGNVWKTVLTVAIPEDAAGTLDDETPLSREERAADAPAAWREWLLDLRAGPDGSEFLQRVTVHVAR